MLAALSRLADPTTTRGDAACETAYRLTARSPVAKGAMMKEQTLDEISDAHGGKTPTQVALRWLTQQDKIAAIAKAGSDDYLKANLIISSTSSFPATRRERISALNGQAAQCCKA